MGAMAGYYLQCFWVLSFSFSLYFVQSISTSHVYVVYLGLSQFRHPMLTSKSHIRLLSNVFASEEEARQSMLYSYKRSFSGFSAILNSTQATTLANTKGVISVFRSKTLKLHTTRSWDFLGLTLDCTEETKPLQLIFGDDTIVGIFDTGIWPESESFKAERDLGPIPSTWKGQCVKGDQFDPKKACNRKLIGARYYLKGYEQAFGPLNLTDSSSEYRSARDFLGHGTHTASTAVGSIVKDASFFGFGLGTARGGAPRARLAVYKVCWGNKDLEGRCTEADILAAFEDALHDGVNVISASFGAIPPLAPFFASSADIGSFHAMQLGVNVVFSAGNNGPDPSLVQNVAPWSISVAASTVDRTFPTQIILNSSFSIMGESLITKEINGKLASSIAYFANGVCKKENWKGKLATGRVILCFSTIGSLPAAEIPQAAVARANGSAVIFVEPPTKQTADVDVFPTIRVDIDQGTKILNFLAQSLNKTIEPIRMQPLDSNAISLGPSRLPAVQILPSRTVIGKSPAPVIAPFSSRGPSSISSDILKPDVTAPGINILAAWPPKTPPTLIPGDDRSVKWNFQSGTSMSCPHVAGVVALLKSAHPDWSPAAIRSALMTTAYTRDTTRDSILAGGSPKVSDPFDIGAGHINPLKAIDPGLVYDMKTSDYIVFLCNLGYTKEQIEKLVGTETSCSCAPKITNANLNYPSITVTNLQSSMIIKRSVRNVGYKKSAVYFVSVIEPNGVKVSVRPPVLIFSGFKKEISYYVTLKPVKTSQGRYDFGEIVWSDGIHTVRSPLVVLVNAPCDGHGDDYRVSAVDHASI